MTEDDRRVRAWLEVEIGREPDQDLDEVVEACLRALAPPDDADEAAHIAARWAVRFGPIRTPEQFEAIVRTANLGRLRRAGGAPRD